MPDGSPLGAGTATPAQDESVPLLTGTGPNADVATLTQVATHVATPLTAEEEKAALRATETKEATTNGHGHGIGNGDAKGNIQGTATAQTYIGARFGLHSDYANLRPLTQLWLASRIREPEAKPEAQPKDAREEDDDGDAADSKDNTDKSDQNAGAASGGEDDVAEKQDGDKKSRKLEDPTILLDKERFHPPGSTRPMTLTHLRMQIEIWRLMVPRLVEIGLNNRHLLWYVVVHLLGIVVAGVIPAASALMSSKLLDLVATGLDNRAVAWNDAVWYGALAVGLATLVEVQKGIFQHAALTLRKEVEVATERAYVSASLDLAQQVVPDLVQRAIVHDAAVIGAGKQLFKRSYHTSSTHTFGDYGNFPFHPWAWLDSLSTTASHAIQVLTNGYLMLGLINREDAGVASNTGTMFKLMLVVLSLAPGLLTMISTWLYEKWTPAFQIWTTDRTYLEEETVKDMVENNHETDEVALFGLKAWTLERWDALQDSRFMFGLEYRSVTSFLLKLSNATVTATAANILYVLLAMRIVETSMTLGTIHVHQRLGDSIVDALRAFLKSGQTAWQVTFLLAATLIAADGLDPVNPGTVDYEDHRTTAGMRIEVRNLTFSHKYGADPVLKGIDLTIEPGETLALVGFNGSGKTTLAKALLGLHSHLGSIKINGKDIRQYRSETLHARMSCLFQTFHKYSLSLGDNIGLGDTKRMGDADLINQAVERGGVDAICKGIGLNGWLSASNKLPPSHTLNEHGDVEAASDKTKKVVVENHKRAQNDKSKTNTNQKSNKKTADKKAEDKQTADDDDKSKAVGLSGGQWQRVALARAFMRADTADLIVFDEPSASLDPRAEVELFDRIHNLSNVAEGGRSVTTIFISHQFSSVRRADKIAFMELGRIIEYGSHAELMELKGKYFECFELQRSGYL